ncbi:Vitellogenin-2 [Chelonia mydas]|uniref:Vitellogenin-2 n=1 Tax=Chelonia mydas TaxID=8469 RepID=M7AWF9_CHEMY|nr:Vitellogenin-2 [Chelonia mydas]
MRRIILALMFAFVGSQKYDIGVFSEFCSQILSPQLDEYNGIWPRDPFTRSSKLILTIASCLTQLFKFEYNRGQFGNIYAPKDTPVTCVNLVRGILNMLQITVKKSQNAYDLQEAGIGGVCHTRYIIQEDRKSNRVTVFKTKDLNNCQDKVEKNIGMAYIRSCATCPLKEKIIKGTAAFTYKMKYTDAGTLITQAVSQQVYQISPFSEPAGVAVMEARQELTLNDIRNSQASTSEIQLQNYGSLRYHFARELLQMPIHLIKMKNPESQIVEILQQLIQHDQQGYNREAPAKFLELIQLCRVATPENLESLWKQFADKPQYRRWLLSAICAAGTTETFMFLKQKIHNEDMSYLESALTIALAFHLSKADDHTLQAVADLVTSFRIQRAPMLRKLAYLAYGSMINRYCSVSSSCPNRILQPLHDLAAEAVSKNHEDDMALALKAIGNAGEPASIKRILKFLPIFSPAAMAFPVRIYIDAVLALRKIARKDPSKVQEILLQIFVDHSLTPTVRMMACVVIFETKPALPLVTAMANALLKESSLQVASFTYSHMKVLAISRIPQLFNVSAACNIALKLLSPRLDRLSYRYSKVIHVGGYYSKYRAGAIGRIYLMNSPSSMLPSAIIMKLRGYYANTATDFVEVALQSQGLTELVRKQNIPFAEYDTYKKLKVLGKTVLGWKELPPENPLISAYVKVFGHELAFADVNKELIRQTVKALTESSDRHMLVKKVINQIQRGIAGQWTQAILAGEVRHIVPTCVGLPLELSLYSTGLIRATASVGVNMSPSLSGTFKPLQFFDANVQLHADINPSIYTHTVAMMGINTQYFQSGLEFHAKFRANIPMKFYARINIKDKSLKFETTPCHQETELVTARTKLYAISRNVEEITSAKRLLVLPEEAVLDISEQRFKSAERTSRNGATTPKFLGDSKPPILAVILRAVRNDRKLAGFQLVLYADLHSTTPRIQVFVSNISESSIWKLCADASIVNSYKAVLTIYDRDISLPLPLPLDPHISTSVLQYPAWNFFTKIPSSVIDSLKGHCSVSQNMITTFNEVEFNYSMPANCYHVLAQDCSPELKFLVMMKKAEESADLKAINIKLASHEIDMYPSNGLIQLMINGVQTPAQILPYTSNSDAHILISSEKDGLSVKAPEYGIDKLYYDGHTLKIQVGFWMAGKTCGICGKYDGESKQKYQMPSGYVAKDAVSFAQSWILSEEPCAGACKLQHTLIKIEKPVGFENVASKCYSVEPVLRCVKGCSATRTAPVFVGFHCVPADSTTSFDEEQIRLDQKSEDLENTVDAHTMCSCEQLQCAA